MSVKCVNYCVLFKVYRWSSSIYSDSLLYKRVFVCYMDIQYTRVLFHLAVKCQIFLTVIFYLKCMLSINLLML